MSTPQSSKAASVITTPVESRHSSIRREREESVPEPRIDPKSLAKQRYQHEIEEVKEIESAGEIHLNQLRMKEAQAILTDMRALLADAEAAKQAQNYSQAIMDVHLQEDIQRAAQKAAVRMGQQYKSDKGLTNQIKDNQFKLSALTVKLNKIVDAIAAVLKTAQDLVKEFGEYNDTQALMKLRTVVQPKFNVHQILFDQHIETWASYKCLIHFLSEVLKQRRASTLKGHIKKEMVALEMSDVDTPSTSEEEDEDSEEEESD